MDYINENIELLDLFEVDFLQKIQDDFSKAFGFGAITLDLEKSVTKATNFTDFCVKYTRNSKIGCQNCINCDLAGGNCAVQTSGPVIYACHAGLTDFAVPIMLNDKHLGSILCGQVLTEAPDIERCKKLAKEYGIDEDEYIEALKKVKIVPIETIEAAAKSLYIIANNISEIAHKNHSLRNLSQKEILIRNLTNVICSTTDIDTIYSIACGAVAKFFAVQRVYIVELTEDNIVLKKEYLSQISKSQFKTLSPVENKLRADFWWQSLKNNNKNAFQYSDIKEGIDLPENLELFDVAFKRKNGIAAIIEKTDKRCLMFIAEELVTNKKWSAQDLEFLYTVAKQLKVSLNQARLYNKLKDAAAQTKAILDNIPFPAWLKDSEGRYIAVNEVFSKLKYLSGKEVVGLTDRDLFSPEAALEKRSEDLKVLETKEAFNVEKKVKLNNKDRWINVCKMPVYGEDGEIYAIAGVMRDTTDEKEVAKVESEFISMVSHELRTPLTSIRGSLELMLNGLSGEINNKMKGLLTIADNNSLRLNNLINDILDIKKIEEGKIDFIMEPFEFKEIFNDTLNAIDSYAKTLDIEIKIDNKVPDAKIYSDKCRLMQVLINVISNAIKFSKTEKFIDISIEESKEHFITLSVTNYGTEIADDMKDKVFQKFSQLDCSLARSKGGTGLGLNIAKILIESMHGGIDFCSKNGATTFYIDVPKIVNA